MSLPLKIGEQEIQPVKDADGELIPHAYTFASIINAGTKVYSYRWDEAIKDSRQNALAARRDAYLRALEQERVLPTTKLNWALQVDNKKDARQRQVVDGVTKALRGGWRWRRLMRVLLGAVWYGRYGAQVKWERAPELGGLYRVVRHSPVNGDKIQYQWDGTPVVMISAMEANRISRFDPQAIVPTNLGLGLRLYKPEYRDRFIIHQHEVDDADYFDGEMAGAVHGTGLRSIMYWCYWLRQEMLDWMVTTMQTIGATELAIVNYETGNAEAKDSATAMAKKLPGKIVFIMPRSKGERYQSVEMVSINTAGVEVLSKTIQTYFDAHIERLWVGQSLSANTEGGGLGGAGVAHFHADTKYQLLDWDANNLAETLTEQLVAPCIKLNYPWCDFPVRLEFSVPNPDAEMKLGTARALRDLGVTIRAQDVRDVTGFAAPDDGEEAIGGGLFGGMFGGPGQGERAPSPAGADGGALNVQGLLDRFATLQADFQKLLTASRSN